MACRVCAIAKDQPLRDCSICHTGVCLTCSEEYCLKSLGETRSQVVCASCEPKIRGEITKLRSREPIDITKFTQEERTAIENGKQSCTLCRTKFGPLLQPYRCGTCTDIVCFRCCFDFADAPLLLPSMKSGCACRACWPGWQKKLQLELKTAQRAKDASSEKRIAEELSLGNRFLVDLQAADIKHPLEARGRTVADVKDKKCPYCANAFGVWLSPTQCHNCEAFVCIGKSCSQYFSVLDGTHCRACWPKAKDQVQRAVLAAQSEATAAALQNDVSSGVFFFEQVTPAQYYEALRKGKPLTHGAPVVELPKRRAIQAACKLCHQEFDKTEHAWKQCSECSSEVCVACGQSYILKSAGETAPRFICNVCEHVVRARLGKMATPVVPASVARDKAAPASPTSPASSQPGDEDDMLKRLLSPQLYEQQSHASPASIRAIDQRMNALRETNKAMLKRNSFGPAGEPTEGGGGGSRVTVMRTKDGVNAAALEALERQHFFDSLSTQTWSHIAALLPLQSVRGLASTNQALRDMITGWTHLRNFNEEHVGKAKRVGVVPGISPNTSHVGFDEIVSLHFGAGGKPTFQVYRFRPTVEPRFECELGEHAPAFAMGTSIVSDGHYIAVRSRLAADAGKPISYTVFQIVRAGGAGGKITGIPFRSRITARGTRGAFETLYRGVLYAAHFDKAAQQFVVESFACINGACLHSVTVAAAFSGAKVQSIMVETRHVYLLVHDANGEQPFRLLSFNLELHEEANIPLDAFWNVSLWFCKHHVAYFVDKTKSIKEVGFNIDHERVTRERHYPLKLKRGEEVRCILLDSQYLAVVTSMDAASVFSRGTQKLVSSFKLPTECVTLQAFESHIVFVTPVKVSKTVKGLLSPRKGSNADEAQLTQGEVFSFV